MRYAAIDNMDALHTVASGVQSRGTLRQHTARQGAIGHHVVDITWRQTGQQIAFFVENTWCVGQQHELFGTQDFGHLASNDIGIDVVGFAVWAKANRCDHRNEGTRHQVVHDGWVDLLDVTDQPDINQLTGVALLGQHELFCPNQAGILAGTANGFTAIAVDKPDDVLVHFAAEHHLDHAHSFCVGHPHTLDELAFFTDLGEHLLDLWTATVDDNRVQSDQFEQHHIIGERLLQALFRHGIATVFHDNGLAVETFQKGECFGQNFGFESNVLGHLGDVHKYSVGQKSGEAIEWAIGSAIDLTILTRQIMNAKR